MAELTPWLKRAGFYKLKGGDLNHSIISSINIIIMTCDSCDSCGQSGRVQRHCFQQSWVHKEVGRRERNDADGRNDAGEGEICRQTFRGRARGSGKGQRWARLRRETEVAREEGKGPCRRLVLAGAEVVVKSSEGKT